MMKQLRPASRAVRDPAAFGSYEAFRNNALIR